MRGLNRLRGRKLAVAGVAAVAAVAGGSFAVISVAGAGAGFPADKAVAGGSKVQALEPNAGPEELMRATLRTSKPEDLILQVTAECDILTDVTVGGNDMSSDTQSARGAIRIWLEIADAGAADGKIVPITDVSNPPQDPTANGNGDDTDKVTFCDRLHKRSVEDAENNLPMDNTDKSQDIQDNGFNWVRLNLGSGIHDVIVKGELTTEGTATATADGYVGTRTLVIEPTKLANDAIISANGS
jgi:hypothetical protein